MALEQTIIEEWERVRAPSAPELTEVKLKLKETALLVLDIQNNNCNEDRRLRCLKRLHHVQLILEKARNSEMVIRHILPLALTFDHRAVTGGEAARFMKAVVDDLEN